MAKTKKPRVSVLQESSTGRNKKFIDNKTGIEMTRAQFSEKIDHGDYPGYYTRQQGGLKTPVSKPDGNSDNNLD